LVPRQQIANYLHAFQKAKSVKHVVLAGADHALSKRHWRVKAIMLLTRWLTEERRSFDALNAPLRATSQ